MSTICQQWLVRLGVMTGPLTIHTQKKYNIKLNLLLSKEAETKKGEYNMMSGPMPIRPSLASQTPLPNRYAKGFVWRSPTLYQTATLGKGPGGHGYTKVVLPPHMRRRSIKSSNCPQIPISSLVKRSHTHKTNLRPWKVWLRETT